MNSARTMDVKTDKEFTHWVETFPKHLRLTFDVLQALVHRVAQDSDVLKIHQILKWGEPSFVTKHGSTLRLDWKEKSPSTFALYFQCSSKLVDTFKLVFLDVFSFKKNRAIHLNLGDKLPIAQLSECIRVTLWYHKLKHLPLLGL